MLTLARAAVTLREGRLITKKEALDMLASAGAPPSMVGDIRERRHGTPPPISDEWRAERGDLASTYIRQGIQRKLSL